jgi:hypothetical protein
MKNLFDTATMQEVSGRIAQLKPDATRQWGEMDIAQVMAHCSIGFETALGVQKPPRVMLSRILGPVIKPLALRDDKPMKKNSPTAPSFIVKDGRDFETEQVKLTGLMERFKADGAKGCTDHPHAFFGQLTPDEWAILMYKHMDHHLRQFGV